MKIKSLIVKNLNGYLSSKVTWKSESRCQVIYGENGSGKTSIMTAVYHLLSPEETSGHRTYLANTIFEEIRVSFYDGHTVSVLRKEPSKGSYVLSMKKGRGVVKTVEVIATEDEKQPHLYVVRSQGETLDIFYLNIASILNDIVFMPDDRAYIKSDSIHSSMTHRGSRSRMYSSYRQMEMKMSRSQNVGVREMQDFQLNAIAEMASGNIEDQIRDAIIGSNRNTDEVYLSVVREIAKGREQSDQDGVLNRVKSLREEMQTLSIFGSSHTDETLASFEKTLDKSKGSSLSLIQKVLLPYIESTEKRVQALTKVDKLVKDVLEEFSEYFSDKEVSFTVKDGFTVSRDNRFLPLTSLSSGERQLLFIFFSILATVKDDSIIMIDEPEISLNVTWQRLLPGTIERLAGYRGMQVIMASHSIEMINQMPEESLSRI